MKAGCLILFLFAASSGCSLFVPEYSTPVSNRYQQRKEELQKEQGPVSPDKKVPGATNRLDQGSAGSINARPVTGS
jgi:hypothetical protein